MLLRPPVWYHCAVSSTAVRDPADLTRRLKAAALDLGFSIVGVVAARPGKRLDAYHRWLDNQ